ncbi:MAG: CPBP family intramembrane metalloprotease [Phycisphaerales bacterium]|nr:MAG: CPBP family intramembrane metalloprotease [Phycisphaerales bacterium]
MSDVADRSPQAGHTGRPPLARPVGVSLPYARPVFASYGDPLLLRQSRGAVMVDIVMLVGLFVGLEVVKEAVFTIVVGDAPHEVYREWTPASTAVSALVVTGAVLLIARARGQSRQALGLVASRWPGNVGIGLLGGFAVLFLTVIAGMYIQFVFPELIPLLQESQENINKVLPPMSLGTILALCIAVSFYEELLFRGFVLPRLRVLTGSWWSAVLLGAASFGLLHLYEGALTTIPVMALAAFLSVQFIWRRSLVAPMVTHFIFNAVQLILLQKYSEVFGPVGML